MKHLLTILLAGMLVGCTEQKPKADSPEDQMNRAFDVGLKFGYSISQMGGTKEDVKTFSDAFKSNRVDLIDKWIAEHSK
jgi:hypothetical protein